MADGGPERSGSTQEEPVRVSEEGCRPAAASCSESKGPTLSSRSAAGSKRAAEHHDASRLGSAERSGAAPPCLGPQRSDVLPSHPFVQDPTMPPNPAPSSLIQLEEVRRRLEEEELQPGAFQPKQR